MLADPRARESTCRCASSPGRTGSGTHVAYRDIRDLTEAFDVASAHETIGRLGALLPQLVAEMTTGD